MRTQIVVAGAIVVVTGALGSGSLVTAGERQTQPQGRWRTVQTTDPIDDSKLADALIEASQGIGLTGTPIRLIARCRANQTEVYINWYDYLGNTTRQRVTYRFPPAVAETELWNLSTDHVGTFVAQPIAFLRRLAVNERLVVRTTPYNEAPKTAIFDLTGAQEALEPVAKTCQWILDADEADRVQREREAREARARRERQPELDRILASVVGAAFTEGLERIGGDDEEVYADLPSPVGYGYFAPGITVSHLAAAARVGSYTVVCPHGEWEGDEITLRRCTVESSARMSTDPGPRVWYQGGTLHTGTGRQWLAAMARDRLGTAADFVVRLWREDGHSEEQIQETLAAAFLRAAAEIQVDCITNMLNESGDHDVPVASLAAACYR